MTQIRLFIYRLPASYTQKQRKWQKITGVKKNDTSQCVEQRRQERGNETNVEPVR